jgi:hypothetical protein
MKNEICYSTGLGMASYCMSVIDFTLLIMLNVGGHMGYNDFAWVTVILLYIQLPCKL